MNSHKTNVNSADGLLIQHCILIQCGSDEMPGEVVVPWRREIGLCLTVASVSSLLSSVFQLCILSSVLFLLVSRTVFRKQQKWHLKGKLLVLEKVCWYLSWTAKQIHTSFSGPSETPPSDLLIWLAGSLFSVCRARAVFKHQILFFSMHEMDSYGP